MPVPFPIPFARGVAATVAVLSLGACTSRGSASGDTATAGTAAASTAASSAPSTTASSPATTMSFSLTSSAFADSAAIPSKYSCEGAGVSPPLAWSGAPTATRSFALIVDDPDVPDPAAPKMTYVHWVVYNIPATTASLAENASVGGMPAGAVQGNNGSNKSVYASMCPPIGRHRYYFKLYALDAELSGLTAPGKSDLEKAMQGHVIGTAQLMGTYQKAKK